MSAPRLPARATLDRSPEGIESPANAYLAPRAPRLVRCEDCRLDLDPAYLVRAAFACPLFGKPRAGVERICKSFVQRYYPDKGKSQ